MRAATAAPTSAGCRLRRPSRSRVTTPRVVGGALRGARPEQAFRVRALRRALQHIASHRDRCWLTTAGAVADADDAFAP